MKKELPEKNSIISLTDMRSLYSIGDLVVLKESCRTANNKYKKDEMFLVYEVSETIVRLNNEKGNLTIHRFLKHMIEKA